MRLIAVVLLLACGRPPPDHECVYSGDFDGSTSCALTEASLSGETTHLRIESEQGQPIIDVRVEAARKAASCNALFYADAASPDRSRIGAVFTSESCTLALTSVEPPHGTLTVQLVNGSAQPKRTTLTASF